MRKFIDDLLNKLTTRQMSWLILILGYVFVLCVLGSIQLSENKLFLTQTQYHDRVNIGTTDVSESDGSFYLGPDLDLANGNWKVTIQYETEKDTKYDLLYRDSDDSAVVVAKGEMSAEKHHDDIVFNLKSKIDEKSFEIRTYYPGEGHVQIKDINIKHCLVFKWYVIITAITAAATIALFMGKSFFRLLEVPKQVLYFTCFYAFILTAIILSMIYMPEQKGEGLYIFLNLLIILHGYGQKRNVYMYWTRRNVSGVLGVVYIMLSLYILDLAMRYETSDETGLTYSSYEPNLFTFAFIGSVILIISIIPKRWIKRLAYGITYFVFLILYAVQRVYYQVFNKLFSFKDLGLAKEGSDYTDYVLKLLDGRFIRSMIIFIILGVVGIFLIRETFYMKKAGYLVVVSIIASIIMYNHTLYGGDYGEWNSFDNANYIYSTMTNRVGAFELCGFYQYELRDLQLSIFGNGFKQKEMIDDVDEYYAAKETHDPNSMTGVLKGKNVIFCLMESIDDIVLNESVMPTLYQMSQKGIYFNNMYASIYGSAATLNSEMATNVGLYAPLDGSLVYSFSENLFPYSMAKLFTEQGYTARQYHFNKPSFYNREFTNQAFGYKEYVCYQDYVENDYMQDDIINKNEQLFDTLVQDEKFFDYIITYSAHLSYDSSDSIVQYALANHPEYSSMTGSEEINNYFAKCRVTDDMLKGLIKNLRDRGMLENTVIVAVGDHYPYGISDVNTLYELSNVEKYSQLLYKVPCVIWSADMADKGLVQQVDKVSSTIDIVPTIVNLFNLGDVSVYVGNDIFNDKYDGIAYFSDGSWITKDVYFYDGKIVYGEMSDDNISKINNIVMEKINANDNILKSDYYREKK